MTGTSKDRKAALGVRCHSGWAAVTVVCGHAKAFEVVERRRIELCAASIPGSKQPFHTAEPLPFAEAQSFLARCRASSEAMAHSAIISFTDGASKHKLKISGCGLLCASGRPLPTLKEILASHALIHAAEGEFYRDTIARACKVAKMNVVRVREPDALRQSSDATGLSEAKIKERLDDFGKSLGPPWTQDEKVATLAALIALS